MILPLTLKNFSGAREYDNMMKKIRVYGICFVNSDLLMLYFINVMIFC